MALIWNKLPEQLPMHWNIKGEIDNYGSKWIFPIMNILIYLLMRFAPLIDPWKRNYNKFENSYYTIRLLMLLFFSIVFTAIILTGTGVHVRIEKIIVPSMLVLFMLIGNYMAKLRFNWFIGIRTPWTMSNEEIWRKTHYFGGKLWFWSCLIALPFSFFLSEISLFIFFFSVIAEIVIVPFIYSYRLYTNHKKKE